MGKNRLDRSERFYGGRINKTSGSFPGPFTKIETQTEILRIITIVAKHVWIAYHVLVC